MRRRRGDDLGAVHDARPGPKSQERDGRDRGARRRRHDDLEAQAPVPRARAGGRRSPGGAGSGCCRTPLPVAGSSRARSVRARPAKRAIRRAASGTSSHRKQRTRGHARKRRSVKAHSRIGRRGRPHNARPVSTRYARPTGRQRKKRHAGAHRAAVRRGAGVRHGRSTGGRRRPFQGTASKPPAAVAVTRLRTRRTASPRSRSSCRACLPWPASCWPASTLLRRRRLR